MPNKKGGKKYKKGKKGSDTVVDVNYPHADGQEKLYALVIKFLGGCNLEVQCSDDRTRIAHIPGSMRKKVWIHENDLVLITKRTMMTEDKECDIAYKYDKNQTKQLKRSGEIKFDIKESSTDDKISFDDCADDDDDDNIDPFKKLEKKQDAVRDANKTSTESLRDKQRDNKKKIIDDDEFFKQL